MNSEHSFVKGFAWMLLGWPVFWGPAAPSLHGQVVFDKTSPYHHIRVVDRAGIRTLSFDNSMETRMSLRDPSEGHFEYTEYFHMPWLWNDSIGHVLMIGLGGGSTQRAYQRYYPDMVIETVELDPVVVEVAKRYFHVKESSTHNIHIADGRVYLRRTNHKFDAILMDAYTRNRYGSSIPHHLATKEFFELAHKHLKENGVLAYNVITGFQSKQADILGALYRTMNSVFPNIYLFQARTSRNVVLIATKAEERATLGTLLPAANRLVQAGKVKMPHFAQRVYAFSPAAPPSAAISPLLKDDYAPVDGLLHVQ